MGMMMMMLSNYDYTIRLVIVTYSYTVSIYLLTSLQIEWISAEISQLTKKQSRERRLTSQ